MIAMVVMRAYMAIMKDRPPGNVHAGQKFWIGRLPKLNDRLTTRLRCLGKECKNNRGWITFASETTDEVGEILFRGRMTTIWAA
jgi:acyl dehydratase